jgi:hypothetical protein
MDCRQCGAWLISQSESDPKRVGGMMKAFFIVASALSFFTLLGRTVVVNPGSASAQFTRLEFKGTAQSTEMYGANYPLIPITANGSGSGSELGQFVLSYKGEINMTDLSTVETAQFVGMNGNSINVTGVGQTATTTTPGIYSLIQIYKVTGGTGLYANAKGTITVNRTVNMTSGATSSTFDGFLLIPSGK